MSFSAERFIGKTAIANKDLILKANGKTIPVKSGNIIGTIYSWTGGKGANDLKFQIDIEKDVSVFVSPKDIVGGALEEGLAKEDRDKREQEKKKNETLIGNIGEGIMKMFMISVVVFVSYELIKSKI